jgi:signal peptidase II
MAYWPKRHPRQVWLIAVAALIFADQISKTHFSTNLALGEGVLVTEWLNFVHVLNRGAAFSLLADAGGWQRWFFIGVSVLVVGFVSAVCLARQALTVDRLAGALVVGGGGVNLIDRVQMGAVVDFIDVHWRGIHWPAFNLADVFIVGGALVWCLFSIRSPARPVNSGKPEERPAS